jgi:hypothetical protein
MQIYRKKEKRINKAESFSNFIIFSGCDISNGSAHVHMNTFFELIVDFYK